MVLAIVIVIGCCILAIMYPEVVIKILNKLKGGGKIRW